MLTIATTLADMAGEIARRYFRNSTSISFKQGASPVTEADLAIESALRDYLTKELPHHGIWGEEFARKPADSEYTWVIDPIDGTASFACGKPTFCTLIALLHQGIPILGIIDQPIIQERWIGLAGQPTQWNNKPCVSRSTDDITPIRLSCTTPALFTTAEQRLQFEAVKKEAAVVSYGGDGYAYGLLATGFIDIILEADLQFYDVAALIPIIEGAGGVITDWQGGEIEAVSFKGSVLATSNKKLHAVILNTLTTCK